MRHMLFLNENVMIKYIFSIAISLILRPLQTWKELKEKQEDGNESFLSNFIYPFIGVVTIAAFIGVLFTRKGIDFQIALKTAILVLLSVFGGFFLASYIINEVWHSIFKREREMSLCLRFVGYSSSLIFVLYIVLSLLPEFFFLRIFVLYTIYIVWEGAIPYMDVKESEQLKFVIISTIIIIATPLALELALGKFMPGLIPN